MLASPTPSGDQETADEQQTVFHRGNAGNAHVHRHLCDKSLVLELRLYCHEDILRSFVPWQHDSRPD